MGEVDEDVSHIEKAGANGHVGRSGAVWGRLQQEKSEQTVRNVWGWLGVGSMKGVPIDAISAFPD
jgi:hypothetical protein